MYAEPIERRSGVDRRHNTMSAVWYGVRRPRRRGGRRAGDDHYAIADLHSPRVFGLALLILGLCILDGIFTVHLMAHGAEELNPVMAQFLPHDLGWFAAVKLALTVPGVIVLVACSQMRLFRSIPGEAFLYLIAGGYVALIIYELELLQLIPLTATVLQ